MKKTLEEAREAINRVIDSIQESPEYTDRKNPAHGEAVAALNSLVTVTLIIKEIQGIKKW